MGVYSGQQNLTLGNYTSRIITPPVLIVYHKLKLCYFKIYIFVTIKLMYIMVLNK